MINVPPKRIWSKNEIALIVHKYTQEGLTTVQISKSFHTKADTISKLLKENGIEICKRKKNRLLKDNYFENIDTPLKAYFLGLIFTDGSICNDTDGIRSPALHIELAQYDNHILLELKKELNIEAPLHINRRDNNRTPLCVLTVRSKKLAEDLSKYGVVPNKTEHTTHLPLDKIPNYYYKDFFRGIIDGDGSIYFSKNRWHLNVCGHKKDLIQDIYELGCLISEQPADSKLTLYDGVYRITWNGEKAKKLLTVIYYTDCCALNRKYEKAIKAINS